MRGHRGRCGEHCAQREDEGQRGDTRRTSGEHVTESHLRDSPILSVGCELALRRRTYGAALPTGIGDSHGCACWQTPASRANTARTGPDLPLPDIDIDTDIDIDIVFMHLAAARSR